MNWPPNNNKSFQLDNRTTLELQNFVLQFAAKLEMEGSEEVVNWQRYLLKDISFRLAYLLSVDYNNINNTKEAKEHFYFIGITQKYLSKKAEQHKEDLLFKKIQKDFEDLVSKFLPKNKDVKEIKDFYKHLRANLFDTYQESLKVKSNHAPDIGLLFTFIQLFQQHLLQDINKLPPRLTEFYYESIIDKKRIPSLPNIAHVYFEPAQFVKQSIIKKGVSLFAGKDVNKNNIIFKTQDTVQLSQAALLDIRTLYFTTSNESGTQGIFKRHCFSGEAHEDFETFGKNIALYKEPEIEEVAEFGFAIASKLLFLKEGERFVTLRLPQPEDSKDDWKTIFEKNCYFEITTKKGWASIESFEIISTENWIEINLKFLKELAPIEPFIDFSDLPAISCLLNRKEISNRVQSFNQLKNFQINPKSIELEVKVEGIQDLTCYNDLGILNISQPFQPFGATPAKYSKFIIGSAEVFQKALDKVTLHLDWNLPDWDFKTYFEAYKRSEITDLDEYKVKFNSSNGKTEECLFEGVLDNRRSSSITTTIDIQQIGPIEWSSELPAYRKDAKWGYLEMQLISPSYPFGTGLYQQVMANQFGKDNNQVNYLINPPMIPELGGIQLSYKSKIDENEKEREHQFYHIHPFGKELIENEKCSLITRKYEEENIGKNYHGILFLGIKNLTFGLLSIYFELAGSSLIPSNSETKVTSPTFFLVCDNQFIPITKVSDSTEGFELSGIIQLNIESSFLLTSCNTLLSPNLNWIAVVAQDNVESFGLTKRINLHGTTAIRVTDVIQQNESKDVFLESGSINRTFEDIPAIKNVIQPNSSFSGRTIEEVSSFSKRISAEIRHRNRPSKSRDIEAIIYGEFPQVHQCRVFSDNNQISVVIVPFKHSNIHRPAFAISFLKKVKSFVEKLVSPFLQVVVENPHYAILQTNTYLSLNSNISALNLDQFNYKIRQELIGEYLTPWTSDSYLIGEIPNFTQLKILLEKSFEQFSVEGFVFYYYYYSADNISYAHYFFSNRINTILSKKVIFLPDENINFHKIHFKGRDEFKNETDKTGTITPDGFYYPPTNKSI